MKTTQCILLCMFLTVFSNAASAQLKVGDNPTVIAPASILELESTNKGFLMTRLTDTTRINLLNPPDGMLVYYVPTKTQLIRSQGKWKVVIDGDEMKRVLNGAVNYVPKFNTANTLVKSTIQDNGLLVSTNAPNGFIATGTYGVGNIPNVAGAGSRLMWIPSRGAFRVGTVDGIQWDSMYIGDNSIAFGQNSMAAGSNSIALGWNALANNNNAIAIGVTANAGGVNSIALGNLTTVSGNSATVMGYSSIAAGNYSTATGNSTFAQGTNSFTSGYKTIASGANTTAMGSNVSTANKAGSFIIGDRTTAIMYSDAISQMKMRFSGGYKLFTDSTVSKGIQIVPEGMVKYYGDYSATYDSRTLTDKDYVDKRVAYFAITSLNGLTANSQMLAVPGTNGIAPNWVSVGTYHTLHIPLAATGGVTAGLVSNAQWNVFNNKVATARAVNTALPLLGGGDLSADRTISIKDAAADAATKGAATFTVNDFDAAAGLVSIDYTNGQTASTTNKGFLTAADWNIFNNKVATARSVNTASPLLGGGDLSANRTLSIADAAADAVTKGAATFAVNDFNAAAGLVSIDYANAQQATATTKGFVTAADWNTFNNKQNLITTGDVTGTDFTITGGNSAVIGTGLNLSLPVVNATTGVYGSTSFVPQVTVNAKGLVTNVVARPIDFPVTMVNGWTGNVALGITDLTDAGITAPVNNQVLQYNGTKWVNANFDSVAAASGSYSKANLTETGSAVLSVTGGTNAVLGAGTSIQVKQAGNLQDGYLSSTDWNIFNNKQNLVTTGDVTGTDFTITGGNSAVIGTGLNLSLPVVNATTGVYGSTSFVPQVTVNAKGLVTNVVARPIDFPVTMVNGWTGNVALGISDLTDAVITAPVNNELLKYDGTKWVNTSFDSVVSASGNYSKADLTETGSTVLTVTGGTGAVLGGGTSIQVKQSGSVQDGFLSSTDWNTFNNKATAATNIFTTAPLQGGGDLSADRTLSITDAAADGVTKGAATFALNDFDATAGLVSIDYANGQTANTTAKGFLTAADWNTFNNKQNLITTGDVTGTDFTITGGNSAVIGTGLNLSLPVVNATTGVYGSPTFVPQVTVNAKGLVTNVVARPIDFPVTMVNGWTGNVALGMSDMVDVGVTAPVTNQVLQYNGTKWVNVNLDSLLAGSGLAGVDTFTANITVTSTNGLGKYATNSVIPAIGKTAKQVLIDALNQVIPPTYIPPTATINSAPPPNNIEIGSNLNVILSTIFNQNDAGAQTGTVYYKDGGVIPANTSIVNNVTSPVSYKAIISYAQGACKLDNHGNLDCTGRINAGSVTTNTITFTPMAKRYWGRSLGVPDAAAIIAGAGGGSEFAAIRAKAAFNIPASGSNNIFYAYPASWGDLTNISVIGLDSFGAFTKSVVSFTNASGYTQNYNVYVSNNPFSGDVTSIIVQ